MTGTSIALFKSNKTDSQITATKEKMDRAHLDLEALEGDTVSLPADIVKRKEKLSASVISLEAELEILTKRKAVEDANQVHREFQVKVARVETALKLRLKQFTRLDEAYAILADAVPKIDDIDRTLIGDIAGVDVRFDLGKKAYTGRLLAYLGEIGIGKDARTDRSIPGLTMEEFAEKYHTLALQELRSHNK